MEFPRSYASLTSLSRRYHQEVTDSIDLHELRQKLLMNALRRLILPSSEFVVVGLECLGLAHEMLANLTDLFL